MGFHWPEVHIHKDEGHHHKNGQNSVKIVRDGADKYGKAVLAFHESGYGCRPGRDRRDNADRSRRSVDQISQFRTGHFVFIRYRFHYAAYCQAVKIIVDKNKHAEGDGSKLSAGTGLDFFLGKMPESSGSSGPVHQTYHGSQYDEENKDSYIVTVGKHGGKAVVKNMRERGLEGKSRIKQPAHQYSDKEGAVDFLCDKGQHDRHDRRNESPKSSIHGRDVFLSGFRCKCGKRYKRHAEQ